MADRTDFDHWNYRVMERIVGDDTVFDMIEVFYDDRGKITAWATASVDGWESVSELTGTLRLMTEAIRDTAVLSSSDLPD